MSDGHFFHDLIEGVVIWEDSDTPKDAPIKTPVEATPENLPHQHAPVDEHMIDALPANDTVAFAAGHVVDAHVDSTATDAAHSQNAAPAHDATPSHDASQDDGSAMA